MGIRSRSGEYYRIAAFSSTVSTVNVLLSKIAIEPLTEKLPSPLIRFYINRSSSANGLKIPFEPDSSDYATNDN